MGQPDNNANRRGNFATPPRFRHRSQLLPHVAGNRRSPRLRHSHAARHDRTHLRCVPHTHPFNGPLSRTTRVSRYQKGKTNLDFTEPRDSERQWHQLGHMQVTDRQPSQQPTTQFFTGRMSFLPPNQQRQSTEGKSDCYTQTSNLQNILRITHVAGSVGLVTTSSENFARSSSRRRWKLQEPQLWCFFPAGWITAIRCSTGCRTLYCATCSLCRIPLHD